MTTFWDQARTFFWNIFNRPTLADIVDIAIVAFLVYQLFLLTRQTRASQVLKGLVVLIISSWLSGLLGLTALTWVLRNIINNGAIVLVILFQPEMRRALEQLGRGAKIERFQDNTSENQRIVSELTACITHLSRRRVGALIVFEMRTGLKDFMETGTPVDAIISAPLLENIFEPNTPLHDGAVIIRGTRVVSAACVLTLSESSALSRELGTRHRAAIGVSETTDAIALIVSEETGIISYAKGGKLTRHLDAEGLEKLLTGIYHEAQASLFDKLRKLVRRGERHDA